MINDWTVALKYQCRTDVLRGYVSRWGQDRPVPCNNPTQCKCISNNREIFVVAILRYFNSWYIQILYTLNLKLVPQPLYTVDPNDKYAYNGAAEALSSIVHISSTCWWTSSHDSSFVCIGADEIHLSCNGFLKSLTSRVTSWVSWL